MIIEAGGKYYTTTQHADERMLEKDITADQIKQVIEQGEVALTVRGDDFYRLKISNREIGVIIGNDERIVTVFIIE